MKPAFNASSPEAGRIARNAIWLYVRLGVTTLTDFAVVRIVLHSLGVEGYGVFSVVMAVVTSLQFLDGTLQGTAQRFLSYEIGCKGGKSVSECLSSAVWLAFAVCGLMIAVGETFGLWFVQNRLALPQAVRGTALAVLQIGILTVVIRTLRIPFVSQIVAVERMGFLASASVFESLCALGAAVATLVVDCNRVQAYACFLLLSAVATFVLYAGYCWRMSPGFVRPPTGLLKNLVEQGKFLSWSVLAAVANVLKYQGVNMLIGAFAGAVFSATWGMSMKLGFALYGFVGCIRMSFSPQIVKLWAGSEKDAFRDLIVRAQRWSFLIMSAFALPIIVFTEGFLSRWIGGELPPQSVAFVRCVAVHFLIDALTGPLNMGILATGRIAGYMVWNSLTMGSGFVLAWVFLAGGLPVWTSVAAVAATNALSLAYRLFYLRHRVGVMITFRDVFFARRAGSGRSVA